MGDYVIFYSIHQRLRRLPDALTYVPTDLTGLNRFKSLIPAKDAEAGQVAGLKI